MENTVSRLVEKDRRVIWHPFTQMETASHPIPIAYAKGAYLYSEEGKKYLDGIASWWVNLHGHSHPYIVEKIKKQLSTLDHMIFAGFTHKPAEELASRLLKILPKNLAKIFYSDNGSTAVEVGIKIALQYWYNQGIEKKRIMSLKGGYHGDTLGAMSLGGSSPFNIPFKEHLFEVEEIYPPFKNQEELSILQIEQAIVKGDIACFIFEPLVQGVGGMRIYKPEALDPLIKLCQEHGVLTIADEVMTGFGRTGTLFASDQLSNKPDIICLSKGLTGGVLPLGATVCSEHIYNAFLSKKKEKAFLHGHSYTANPIACAAALASLDLLQSPLSTLQREMIQQSHKAFCSKWNSHPKLRRCEFLGCILSLEYHSNSPSYFNSLSDRLSPFFLERGILLRPLGNVLYVLPPYCITKEELQLIYEAIEITLEKDS